MAFTLEDGTGITDSNAYTDDVFADTYFADRGVTAWTGTPTVKQEALIKATDYIEKRFGSAFKSVKTDPDQSLQFPRILFKAVMPKALKQATAEYALRALTAELAPDPVVDATGGAVKLIKKKLDIMEKITEYADGRGRSIYKPYPAADAILASLLVPRNRTIR